VTPLDLAGALDRWFVLAAVLVCTGAVAFRFLVLDRLAPETDPDLRARATRRTAAIGLGAAVLALIAAVLRSPLQVSALADPDVPLGAQARALILHTIWGAVWLAQIGLAAAAVVAFAAARNGGRRAWAMAALVSVALACTPSLSGHAIGSMRLTDLAVVMDAVHVLSAGMWLGAMLVLFGGLMIPREGESGAFGAALVAAFSPLALGAAALVGLTGLFGAWLHLITLGALWQSRYGRTLLVKLAAVAVMAGAGAWNWRRAGPALRQNGDIVPMRRSIRAELVVGALVLAATAALIVTPPPGEE